MIVPYNILKYLSEKGRPYHSVLVPEGVIRGTVGDCYDTALIAAVMYPHLKYVEGIAKNPATKEWMLHAWVTEEGKDFAFDLTWKAVRNDLNEEIPVPTEYIGIEMDTLLIAEFVKSTGYKGIFVNRWRNKEIADRLLKVTL